MLQNPKTLFVNPRNQQFDNSTVDQHIKVFKVPQDKQTYHALAVSEIDMDFERESEDGEKNQKEK